MIGLAVHIELFVCTKNLCNCASEVSPTLTSAIEIEIHCVRRYICPGMSRKMRGTLLRACATYCIGVAERSARPLT